MVHLPLNNFGIPEDSLISISAAIRLMMLRNAWNNFILTFTFSSFEKGKEQISKDIQYLTIQYVTATPNIVFRPIKKPIQIEFFGNL